MSLYLIDGHGLAYRAFYAFIRRPLINSKGEETSAVFGFAKTVLNLLEKFDPAYLAVVFDTPEKTFRHEAYAEYKANREEMPDSLISQMPRIIDLINAMSIPVFSLAGYEADDIIATLASRLEESVSVRIVSGDKDLFQLINERTHVIKPGKGGLLDEEIDPKGLEEKTGLRPEEYVDFLALVGDPSDNVPGVSGVGEKTAKRLIKKFHNIDNLYANIPSVSSPAVREKLLNARQMAFLSRDLIRLDRHVPLAVSLEDLTRCEFKRPELDRLLEELEFMRILDGLEEETRASDRSKEQNYRLVNDERSLEELAAELSGTNEFTIDVEASDLSPMRAELAGLAVAMEPGSAWYVPVKSIIRESGPTLTPPREAPGLPPSVVREKLAPVFADSSIKKNGQNIKYDAIVLENAGLALGGVNFDTMLASYCLHPARRSHSLDNLAEEFLGHKMTKFKELFDARTRTKDIRQVQVERVADYACEDADMTLRLKRTFEPLLKSSRVEKLFREVEMPLSKVLMEMEMWGVRLDVPFLGNLARDVSMKLEKIQGSIYELAGESFNINSTQQLRDILFGKLKLKPLRKTKTGFSTDVDVLKNLALEHELPRLVLEYRTLSKLKSTYIDSLPNLVNPRTGRVHTSYNQAVTSTGRLSSSDPNLQNIPIRTALGREIRKAFVAGGEDWVLFDADYSQVELRILAHLSKDIELMRAFEEGADVHRRTAAMMHGLSLGEVTEEMRSRAKTVNFGIIYGMGARGLSQALGIDFKEAKEFIEDYFKVYPGVKRFVDDAVALARREKAVCTLLGRMRQLEDIESSDSRVRSFAERVAVNTPVQGTAADIIKMAMVKISEELKRRRLRAKMILQVHDELLFDLPKGELETVRRIVTETMEAAFELEVPLRVDSGVGRNWLEAHA